MSFPSKQAFVSGGREAALLSSSLQGLNSSSRLVAVPHQCFECDSPAQPDASTGVLQTTRHGRNAYYSAQHQGTKDGTRSL